MGQQQSKAELLYQQVSYGNSEGIKSLRRDGAGLEWMDREGKTPLILACMNPGLFDVVKTLIELGANVNAYRAGRHAGTPLHHAAKRGLQQTVKLLLSHGANALVMNDDCQTPLDVARIKGFSNVVRTIENHLCLFSGWLQELYGPGFLELLAPQLLSRKVWVVVVPCGSRSPRKPFKLELAVYGSLQDAQPRTIIALWKANMGEPNFSQPDPTIIITESSSSNSQSLELACYFIFVLQGDTCVIDPHLSKRWRRRRGITLSQGARRSRIKLAATKESDKEQLQRFCNACKGIPQVVHSAFPFAPSSQAPPATAPPYSEDTELATGIQAYAYVQPPMQESLPHQGASSDPSTSQTTVPPEKGNSSGSKDPEGSAAVQEPIENSTTASIPSAPPLEDSPVDNGPIHYPSIDPLDYSALSPEEVVRKHEVGGSSSSSASCAICLDAPVEGACVPCGHMAGCMSCLNEIKAKNWGCPVCRTKIDQVVRIYAV